VNDFSGENRRVRVFMSKGKAEKIAFAAGSRTTFYEMAFCMMTHNELVDILAKSPRDRMAWGEFYDRFHKHICLTINRELKRLHNYRGLSTVEDLAQEVYAKLLAHDCQALKDFKGQYENSIVSYLEIIAIRTVLTDYSKTKARKRCAAGREVPLDALRWNVHLDRMVDLKEILHVESWEEEFSLNELHEEIKYHLEKILDPRRNKERDGLIFKYYLYAGFEAEEIVALCKDVNITVKRVLNIICEIKNELRESLRKAAVID
jgi:DNA-directed RNA polymerase specialized sigma24 family protein